MKSRIALLLAVTSGLYLLIAGPIPDPLPFVDEGVALLVFVKSMAYLGHDVRKWVPFLRKSKSRPTATMRVRPGVTIDV